MGRGFADVVSSPSPSSPLTARRQQRVPGRRPVDRGHSGGVLRERPCQGPVGVPDAGAVVAAPSREPRPVRAPLEGCDVAPLLLRLAARGGGRRGARRGRPGPSSTPRGAVRRRVPERRGRRAGLAEAPDPGRPVSSAGGQHVPARAPRDAKHLRSVAREDRDVGRGDLGPGRRRPGHEGVSGRRGGGRGRGGGARRPLRRRRRLDAANVRRQEVEGLVALPLGAILLQVHLHLHVLQALLQEGEQRAGRDLGVGDDAARDEGLVRKGEGRVQEAALLEVPVHEVVNLV